MGSPNVVYENRIARTDIAAAKTVTAGAVTTGSGRILRTPGGIAAFAAVSAAVFVACSIVAKHPAVIDYPLISFINETIVVGQLVNVLAGKAAQLYVLSGVLFLSAIVFCWASGDIALKARLLNGTSAALLSGIFGRLLQHIYPTHLRPMHDPALDFHLPLAIDPNALNSWDAFPSDHGAVWFGLALVVLIARSKLGYLALFWALVVNCMRVYLGVHFPSDVVGGAALGILFVSISQLGVLRDLSRRLIAWGERQPALFNAVLFFGGYQVATLFDDVRTLAGSVVKVLHVSPF